MQSIKVDLGFEEIWMSLTHKLDRVYGLREISLFDGEASTSKQDIEDKLVPDRQAKQHLLSKGYHLKFKRCLEQLVAVTSDSFCIGSYLV